MIALIFQNHYERLQVEPSASGKEITRAFRLLARQHHPDVAEDKVQGHKIFLLIKEAHSVLADPVKRADYDRWLEASRRFRAKHPANPVPPPPARPTYKSHQSSAGAKAPRTSAARGFDSRRPHRDDLDAYAVLEVTLEDAIRGGVHTLTIDVDPVAGKRHNYATFECRLPPMAHEGMELTVIGRGRSDPQTRERGNLILRVAYARHEHFRILGEDLYAMVEIWPWDAATGAFMQVPTLEGLAALRIPEGAQPWQKFRLEGRGMPDGNGARGDLLLTLKFVFPKAVSATQKELWKQLKAAYRSCTD